METFAKDIRYALRMLVRSRGFSVVAALTLALGIGANTAIFSVIQTVLLRPLPYVDSQQLMAITGANADQKLRGVLLSNTKLEWLQQHVQTLEPVGGYYAFNTTLLTKAEPEELNAVRATGNFFSILGVKVARGRGFLPAEDQRGGADVAIVSDAFWHDHLGGRDDAVGQPVTLDSKRVTVVGVLPASFRFPFQDPEPDIWFPQIALNPAIDQTRLRSGAGYMVIVGRLRSGQTMAQAQAEINAVNDSYKREFPGYADTGKNMLEVTTLEDNLVGSLRQSLLVLLAAVAFVLLIGCANVASLVLSRTAARRKEIAVRLALGASRGRLVRQLLTESIVLSLGGGALGVLLASWGLGLLRFLPPGTLPGASQISVDPGVLLFTLALSIATGIGVGLAPAVQASHENLQGTLKEGGRGTAPGEGRRTRAALVVGEVAVAVMLLTGAGLLIRSFTNLLFVDPGFQPANVTVFQIGLPQTRYAQPVLRAAFYHNLVERVGHLPGVESASAVSHLPLAGPRRYIYFCPEGTVCQGLGKDPVVALRQITPEFFNTMRIPVLRGRVFSEADAAQTERVVIINQTIANRFFPGQDPVGRHLVDSREQIPMEIVGVVGDVKFNSLSVPNTEEMYVPHAQNPWPTMSLVVRSSSAPQPLAAAVRKELRALDGDLPMPQAIPMQEVIANSVAQPRLTSQCAGAFAALAMILALVGIYGVMAYSVSQRVPELGLRLALGAQPGDVLRLVLGQGMRLVTAGVVLGVVGSFALTRLLSALLFGTTAQDPLTFGGVAVMLTGVALLACYLPARRAMRVDPIVALRYE